MNKGASVSEDSSKTFQGSRWMGDLSDADRRRPLEDLVLPGSRASAACKVLGPPPKAGLKRKLSMTRKAGKESVERWLVTQRLDLTTQLDTGVRAIDLKVSCHMGQLYVSRIYLISPLNHTLETLKAWLKQSPTEYLEVRVFWDPGRPRDREVALTSREEILDLLEDFLVSTTPRARQGITLENAAGKMALVWGLEGPLREESLARWDLKTISARSGDLETVVGRIGKYLRYVEGFSEDSRLRILPLVLDADDREVSLSRPHKTPSSLELAREVRPVVDDYLKGNLPVHVIEIDDVDSDFIKAVVSLNKFGVD